MGLFNVNNKQTNLDLLKNEVKEKSDKKEEIESSVKVFSKKIGENMEYNIRFIYGNNEIPIAVLNQSSQTQTSAFPIKQIVKDVELAMNPLTTANNLLTLNKVKEKAVEKINAINDKYDFLSLDSNAISYIKNYEPEEMSLSYEDLEKLPQKLDLTNLSPEQIQKISLKIQNRLNTLNAIHTPEDAYACKESLESFMKAKEEKNENPLVSAYAEAVNSGETLDEKTVLKIAQKMEKLKNEDGTLYSVYLKIEEKRVWKKIQECLQDYQIEHPENAENASRILPLVNALTNCEIKDFNGKFDESMFAYVNEQVQQMGVDHYVSKIKKSDAFLAQAINSRFADLPDKKTILTFLYARMGNLGQLSYKEERSESDTSVFLRDFVANTDFKSDNCTDTKEYLFYIAEVEKNYILDKYGYVLDLNKEKATAKKVVDIDEKAKFRESLAVPTQTSTTLPENVGYNHFKKDLDNIVDLKDFEK